MRRAKTTYRPIPPRAYYTIQEVSYSFGISEQGLYKWIKEHDIPLRHRSKRMRISHKDYIYMMSIAAYRSHNMTDLVNILLKRDRQVQNLKQKLERAENKLESQLIAA